jgi:uncharacterized protein (DUF302 family)
MRRWLSILLLAVLLAPLAHAEQTTLMARSERPFEPVLEAAKQIIAEHGYTVAHIQKCDGGMAEFGYHSDKYQLIFFGKLDEVRRLSHEFPELIPFLPIKMAVFAEHDETVIVVLDPLELGRYITDPKLQVQLVRWRSDLRSMLQELRQLK